MTDLRYVDREVSVAGLDVLSVLILYRVLFSRRSSFVMQYISFWALKLILVRFFFF